MAQYAAQFETGAHTMEAWQRVSATKLRKKLVKTWTRKYTGIPSKADADDLLDEVISMFSNVNEGEISLVGGGMWECTITFKTAKWAEPGQYKEG